MVLVEWYNPGKLGRRIAQVARVVGAPSEQLALRRVLARARTRGLASPSAIAPWKHLGHYLSLDLDTADRHRILIDHYRYLLARPLAPGVAGRWASGLVLWEDGDGIRYRIRLSQATRSAMEGECQLTFEMDGTILWTLTFVIARGRHLGIRDGMVLAVGGLQGSRDCLERMRQATRDNARLRPHAALASATIALTRALGLSGLVAVASRRRPVLLYRHDDAQLFDVDAFWLEQRAVRQPSGNLLTIPTDDPPDIATGRRHALKKAIRASVIAALV